MPRPAAKRNRLAKASGPAKETAKPRNSSKNDRRGFENASQPPLGENADASQYAGDNEQQAKNQTPTTRRRDHTMESTPGGGLLGTGSRPPTRARGYSSTLSLGRRNGDSNSRIPGTPAFENSVLSNFRRRPRQPSLLQMMQAEDGASDLDDDDFLADLSPNDESTPLNLARRKSLKAHQTVSEPESLSSPSTGGSRKRKRVPEETQVPASPSDIVKDTQNDSALSDNYEDEPDASAGAPSLPEYIGPLSQTMAAPLSSSPVVSPAHTVSARGPGHLAAAAADHKDEAHRDAIPVSTAALQGKVLPRRRLRQRTHRNGSDFEVPSDEDDHAELDDDELSRRPAKTSKSRRKQAQKSRPLAETRAKSKPTYQKKKPESTAKGPGSRERRTFGKENRVENDASDSVTPGPESSPPSPGTPGHFMSEELRTQALKFAEVDKWQMEFEDVAIPGSQASSTG